MNKEDLEELRIAANSGGAEECYDYAVSLLLLARYPEHGESPNKELVLESVRYAEMAADKGHIYAHHFLGSVYSMKNMGIVDLEKSRYFMEEAASRGFDGVGMEDVQDDK